MSSEGSSAYVLHCAETIKGGIATYLRELIPLQAEAFGASNVVVVIPGSQISELPVPAGVRVIAYNDAHGRVANAVALAATVLRQIRVLKPSVLHIHSTFAGAAVRFTALAFRSKCRIVYCPHGWAFDRPMSRLGSFLVRWVERALSRFTDAIVCISEHEQRTAVSCGLPPDKIRVVLNGVSAERPERAHVSFSWLEGRKRLLFVGRFDRQKGVDVLTQALHALGDEVSAIVAGGAVLADGERVQFPRNTQCLGWLSPGQLETLFDSADFLVVPSRWEGFGLIATEAMRAGLAVVASRVGGLPEIVIDGVTGRLVIPEEVDFLVDAIRRIDRSTLREMGRAGRERFQSKFTMGRVHSELADLYRRVLQDQPPVVGYAAGGS